ncbi:MAG TPA: nucleotidyltransferase domain-containing protein [Candidatus Dormibacteraeota bacterium]|nr:nucleotidyltransferase domain-containing protein [Candidatus Dormibacteraeota bacterium]
MFSPEERDRLREAIIAAARADGRITGAAITGSAALDLKNQDRWSDVDLFFGVGEADQITAVMADMTELMYREHGALHHFDVVAGPATYRVYLMSSTLQVDLAFTPASSFGAVTPTFQVLFGEPVERERYAPPPAMSQLDYAWLYAIHTRSSIARGKPWQAEYMVHTARDHVLAAACVRHGLNWREGRGMDGLPEEEKKHLEGALASSLEPAELRRALGEVVDCLISELRLADPALAGRLEPALREIGGG